MGWQDIYKNPYWQYDNNPPDPGGRQTALWATGTDGIRTTARGEEVYMNCRHKFLHPTQESKPNEISKTYWDARPTPFTSENYPKAAYSLRDLFGTNPRCVKVRKGTYDPNNPPSNPEDYEKDFRVSELTDGTLTDWVGAGNNGYIETWYDQVGSIQDDPENITGFLMRGVTNPTTLNGEWYKANNYNGKPIWKHEVNLDLRIIWNGTQWLMRVAGGGAVYFRSSVNTAYPFHKDNVWEAESGSYTGTPTFHSFDGGWYDPTAGEGGMLTQDSESFQPLIVSNGIYLGEIDFSDEYADPSSPGEASELNRDRLNSHFKFNLQPWNQQYLSIFTVAAFDKNAGELVNGNHKNQVFLVNQAPIEAGDAFQRMVFDNAGNINLL